MFRWVLTGGLIPVFLLLCGVFFLIELKGLPLRRPGRMIGAFFRPHTGEGDSPRRALLLALAGTLGVGNIVGVAGAILTGGAGAVFWMWVSALVAMILKYAETVLAVCHRRGDREHGFYGGAAYYIRDYLTGAKRYRAARILPALFSLLMILDALSMGCVIQVNAVCDSFSGVFHLPPWVTGGILLLLTLPFLIRGTRGISVLTEGLVPVMSAGYLILSAAVLLIRREALGGVFADIFRQAFSGSGFAGGVVGILTSQALRVGTMRGLLSNEAGCGTAPTAHASADAHSPAEQGILGIFEVFVDTIVLCTVTALVILVSLPDLSAADGSPVLLTVRAYSLVLGPFAEWFFCAAIFCFGYATLLCWGAYGLESVRFLSRRPKWKLLYVAGFGACIIAGSVAAPAGIWDLSDFAIASLTAVNLVFLFLSRREIREETRRWDRNASSGSRPRATKG